MSEIRESAFESSEPFFKANGHVGAIPTYRVMILHFISLPLSSSLYSCVTGFFCCIKANTILLCVCPTFFLLIIM